jgi:putative FmdB family regulatory protein
MPIYTFECGDCKDKFEDFRNISEKEESGSCLSCGSKSIKRMDKFQSDCDCGCGCEETPDSGNVQCGGCGAENDN